MNATIQCLSRTTYLSNYFLNIENKQKFMNNSNNILLKKPYFDLISNLWIKNNNSISFSPYDFKNTISEMYPLFKGIAANDSKDLILFILQQLHEELKEIINKNIEENDFLDQTNRNLMINNFKESMNSNISIISTLFFGVNEIFSDCIYCRNKGIPIVKYNFQIFNFLIFPLKEVSNYKKSKYNNKNFINFNVNTDNDEVTLYECFEQYSEKLIMSGENAMYCSQCQQISPAYYTTKIYSSPNILILILNRGKGNEFKIKINFEKIISIGEYVELKENKELKYELYAVLTHLGSSDMSGHFIAFCYSIIDKVWYKFNDAMVDEVKDFQKEVHDYGEPYILFYQRLN